MDNMRISRAIKEDTAAIKPLYDRIALVKAYTGGIRLLDEKCDDTRTFAASIQSLKQEIGEVKAEMASIRPLVSTVHRISKNIDILGAIELALVGMSDLHCVCAWLSPLDLRKDRSNASQARLEGTGLWFSDFPEFARWRKEKNEILFLVIRKSLYSTLTIHLA